MFPDIEEKWNPSTGCSHNCIYCYARPIANDFKHRYHKYRNGFQPTIHPQLLNLRFRNKRVFITDMGDLFCKEIPDEFIEKVIEATQNSLTSTFLFLTKNPARYSKFKFYSNNILGVTLESDIDYKLTNAPSPYTRFIDFLHVSHQRKFVSIEPVMRFSHHFIRWLELIEPVFIYIGYDNHNPYLPEPALSECLQFINQLKQFTKVILKGKKLAKFIEK